MTPVRLEPEAPRSRVKHSTTVLSHIRWNDATLDLLSRELFDRFILTLSVKELTLYDVPHFVFAHGVKQSKGRNCRISDFFYNRNCSLKSLSTSE